MDTRKLDILRSDQCKMLALSHPGEGGEVIARIDHATDHPEQLRELVKRWNAYPELIAKLQELELGATQARIASKIGRPTLKDADFLRGELERIGQAARNILNTQ